MMASKILHKDHWLLKAGLINVRVATSFSHTEKPDDVVFTFPHGKVIHRYHSPLIKEGILPKVLPWGLFIKEGCRARHHNRLIKLGLIHP